jgi:hypothetical protein
MRSAALAALLLPLSLAACAAPLRTAVPDAEAALRRPENRGGVMVGDELVRLTWLPPLDRARASHAAADPASFAGLGAGPGTSWLVASRAEQGRAVLTYSGEARGWQRNALRHRAELGTALEAARAASPFRAPVEAKLGAATVWAVGDLVPVGFLRRTGESLSTLELYEVDPRSAPGAQPVLVMVMARRAPSGEEAKRPGFGIISRPDGFFLLKHVGRTPEGQLAQLEFGAYRPDPKAILGGMAAEDVLGTGHPRQLAMEHLLTDALLEWKTRELQPWAMGATPAELEDAVVATEKGMLALDLKSRVVKDAIDAAARGGAGSQPALTERAQVLDQRKTVVGAVLVTLKQARAMRAAPPAG